MIINIQVFINSIVHYHPNMLIFLEVFFRQIFCNTGRKHVISRKAPCHVNNVSFEAQTCNSNHIKYKYILHYNYFVSTNSAKALTHGVLQQWARWASPPKILVGWSWPQCIWPHQ